MGEIIDCNPAVNKVFGYQPSELLGTDIGILMPEDMRKMHSDTIQKAVELQQFKQVGRTLELTALRSSGHEFPINLSLSMWTEGGEMFFTAIIEDISERKNLEQQIEQEKKLLDQTRQELTKQHEEMKKLFRHVETAKREWEQSLDCVSDIVIVADQDGEILRANKVITSIVDRPFLEILGSKWHELLQANGMRKVGTFGDDVEFLHEPTGKSYSLRIHKVQTDMTRSSFAVTLHDITDRKEINRKLEERNNELENAYAELKQTQSQILQQEKMASVGQLAAGVAHEINNPVGFVTSNIGTLSKYVDRLQEYINAQAKVLETVENFVETGELKELNERLKIDFVLEDAKDLINESLEGTERVKKIVMNLKNFSRVDQSDYSKIDINDCMESTLNIVWNELKYKTTVNKDYGELPLTYCYPQQLNQVFMNLLVNAAQAIEESGEITIKTWARDSSIFVTITDTGCGIPKENLGRLFEPFFTTKEVGKGTGLGLSIAYDIVTEKHKGGITVASEPGKGTTFTIKLPIVEEKENA